MDRIIGNFKIERKNLLYEELMQNYNQKEIDLSQEEKPLIQVQNPYENMMMQEFNSNVQVYKNGQKLEKNNYYNDFKTNNSYSQKQPIQETNEPVEQVDPNAFFGNSLIGVINKFK